VVGGRDTCHGNSQSDRGDLGGVQEVGTEETNRNEKVEQEDEQNTDDLGGQVGLWERCRNSQTHHTHRHADTAEHEDCSTTKSVDGEEGDETTQELPGQATTREDARCLGIERETLLEDDG